MTTNATTLSPPSTSLASLAERRSAKLISLVVSSTPASGGAVNAVKIGRSSAPTIETVNSAVTASPVGGISLTAIVNVSLTAPPPQNRSALIAVAFGANV